MAGNLFKVDQSQILDLENQLNDFSKKAVPWATKFMLDDTARFAQKQYKQNARNKMTLRNKFTEGSIRMNKAKFDRNSINNMESRVGSLQPYMKSQEEGTVITSSGKEGKPIPTAFASGEGENATPRKKLVRRPNKMSNISLRNRKKARGLPKRQQNVILVKEAAESDNRYFFMDTGRSKGIFKLVRKGRKTKKGRKGMAIKMVWDMSQKSVRIPSNPMLEPAYLNAISVMPALYEKNLINQTRKFGLFQKARGKSFI